MNPFLSFTLSKVLCYMHSSTEHCCSVLYSVGLWSHYLRCPSVTNSCRRHICQKSVFFFLNPKILQRTKLWKTIKLYQDNRLVKKDKQGGHSQLCLLWPPAPSVWFLFLILGPAVWGSPLEEPRAAVEEAQLWARVCSPLLSVVGESGTN